MTTNRRDTLSVVFLGTYDLSKPRVRLLLAGARSAGLQVVQCHEDIWQHVEDKSQIRGGLRKIGLALRMVRCYPALLSRYVRLPRHDAVVIGYLGLFDLLVLWPFLRIRGVPVVWDMFISLYDTLVNDRRLLSRHSPLAWGLYAMEWLACRLATKVFLDTATHARYVEQLYRLRQGSVGHVVVGAEPLFFTAGTAGADSSPEPFTVLFYGQFIPLHGIDVIVEAAGILERQGNPVRWVVVGRGQECADIDRLIADRGIRSIQRIEWIPYGKLPELIASAHVCLGIFGTSAKSGHVVPNKVFQILAGRKRLITADTPAMRELFAGQEGVVLVPAGNPERLADAVATLKEKGLSRSAGMVSRAYGECEVGMQLADLLRSIPGTDSCPARSGRRRERT